MIESQTADLSSEGRVRANLREARRQISLLPVPGGELILVSGVPLTEPVEGVRCIVEPGQSYYALKNAGMRAACGELVIFTDADCRLGEAYIQRVVELFRQRPDIACVAGRSFYDGQGFITTLNTVLSFGYLHAGSGSTDPYGILAHNVALRAEGAPDPPFGPYGGRVSGDTWLTQWYRRHGNPVLLDRQLVVYHENPSFSPKLRMERQLRETMRTVRHSREMRPWCPKAWWILIKAALSPLWRGRKLFRYGRHLGMTPGSMLLALPVLLLYGIADVVSVLLLILWPPLARRWVGYQNAMPC